MGVPKPVHLPNGKEWKKKGGAADHFQDMLSRYGVGDRVSSAVDHSDLVALVTVYDAEVPLGEAIKAGNGIDYFEKGIDRDHPGKTQCFFIVRKDKSKIDFSIGRALDAAARATVLD